MVFFAVIGDVALQLGFHIRPQQLGFLLVQAKNGGGGFIGDEVLVLVEQAQRIYRLVALVVGVVAFFQLLAGFGVVAQPHQVDAQLRARFPQARIQFQRLAIGANALVVAAIDDIEMTGRGISFAVGRVDFENAVDPRRVVLVVQKVDGETDRHGVQRFAGDPQRQVGLLGGGFFVVVFERQISQLLVRLVKLRIQIGGLLGSFTACLLKPSVSTCAMPR